MADIVKINLNGTDYTIVDSAATSAIASEVSRAQGAESAITSALSAEVVARQSADTQLETALSGKADTATTLAGYGITDAYTSAQTESAITEATSGLASETYVANAITAATSGLQETLTAGTGIDITNNVISCTVDTGLYVVVTTLPAQPAAGNENKIHLVPLPASATGQNDQYEEYLWKGTEWEYLGVRQADIDLSDYWTSAETSYQITTWFNNRVGSILGDPEHIGSVQDALADAGVIEVSGSAITVNEMASEDYVDSAITAATSGLATETYVQNAVSGLASESYVTSAITAAVSGITAEYSAATETLILNIPNPSA